MVAIIYAVASCNNLLSVLAEFSSSKIFNPLSSVSKKIRQLPSKICISGPSNSIIKLSIDDAVIAANICSTVSTMAPFSFITVLRREYSGVLACVIGFCFFEVLKNNKMGHELYSDKMFYVLAITLVVSFVLRTLKRNTKLLNEENRS